jgi:hypothetical protein
LSASPDDLAESRLREARLLPLQWFAELDSIKLIPQLVRGLVAEGSLVVLFGESNSGKTFIVLDLALAVASGQPWCGRHTRRGLVIYVACEGAASLRARAAAYRRKNPAVADGLPFAIVPRAVDFRDPVAVAALIETVLVAETESGEKASLIVVDTFARCIPGGNENDARDVGEAVAAADQIRAQTGATVVFVHHAGKDPTKGARGSSALRAAADTELLVEGKEGPRTLTVTKQRDLEPAPPRGFELEAVQLGTDEDGEPVTSCVVRHLDGILATGKGHSANELCGRAQLHLLACVRAQQPEHGELPWTRAELRAVGRKEGMHRSTAKGAADALVVSPYMVPSVGGYLFTDGANP